MPLPRQLPASSFDPRFRDLLLAGAIKRLELKCATGRQARELRKRLHAFRQAVRREGREEYAALMRAIVTVEPPHPQHLGPSLLVVSPRDSKYNDILSQFEANPVSAPTLDDDPLAAFSPLGQNNAEEQK